MVWGRQEAINKTNPAPDSLCQKHLETAQSYRAEFTLQFLISTVFPPLLDQILLGDKANLIRGNGRIERGQNGPEIKREEYDFPFVPYLPWGCLCNPTSNLLFVSAGIVLPCVHHSFLHRPFITHAQKLLKKHPKLFNVCLNSRSPCSSLILPF